MPESPESVSAAFTMWTTDMARVVEPAHNRVLRESAAFAAAFGSQATQSCYAAWGRREPCKLCVGRQALMTGHTQAKFQVAEGRVWLMVAIPLRCGDRQVAAEHLSPVGGPLPVPPGWEQDLPAVIGLASRDCLTGVYSRHMLEAYFRRLGPEQLPLTVVLIDLDDFKAYNDVHGHAVGDMVLAAFGAFLQQVFGGRGMVFRFGGDEFIALLPQCTVEQARPLLAVFAVPYLLPVAGQDVPVAAAVGCCQVDHPGLALSEVIRQADQALYARKETKKQST